MQDLSGTQLGQYQLIKPIGKGGMATVYLAYQPSMNREVAIKIIMPELASDEEFIARFEREVEIVARLQHPNILPVYDSGRDRNLTYLVMQLLVGGSLADELGRGPLLPDRVIKLTEQIGAALDYAHTRKIVHRDLKPTNVLLDEMGNAFLTDFGIAKLIRTSATSGLTQPGAVMGTPTYMSPEQWRSDPVDGRTDVYALGVMLYQMLAGEVPFTSKTPHSLMYQHLDELPPPPHSLNPQLPPGVDSVLAKALEKDRNKRYASATELAHDLETALKHPTRMPPQRPSSQRPASQRPASEPSLNEGLPPRPVHSSGNSWENQPRRPTPTHSQPSYSGQPARPNPPPPSRTASQQQTMPPRSGSEQPTRFGTMGGGVPPVGTVPPRGAMPSSSYEATSAQRPTEYGHPRTPPQTESYRPKTPYQDESQRGGLVKMLWIVGLVILSLAVLAALVILIWWVSNNMDSNDSSPTAPPSQTQTTPTSTSDASLPSIPPPAITELTAENTYVPVNQPVFIHFTAEGQAGITHIYLYRDNKLILSHIANGQGKYLGAISYTPTETGVHYLEVRAASGPEENEVLSAPAQLILVVR
ncbi:MAG: protein kinase [Anaerolineae bacterium]|nr:protein kinase [Anaerolineae bacterium]